MDFASKFPKTFTDALKRSWTVNLTVQNDDALEAVTGVSIVNLIPAESKVKNNESAMLPFQEFIANPYAVRDAVYALVKPQADAAKVDFNSFRAGLDEGATERMTNALLRAIHDFFPRDQFRQSIIRRVATMGVELASKMADRAELEMGKIDLQKIVDSLPSIDAGAVTDAAIARLKVSASGMLDTSVSIQAQ